MKIKEILEQFEKGQINIDDAEREINFNKYEDLGFAKIDHNRTERTGKGEVVFCQGKPLNTLYEIFNSIYSENGEVLGTRANSEQYNLLKTYFPNIKYNDISKILKLEKEKEKIGNITICTGGTSDIPVAEEAAETAEFFGNNVEKIYDVGVAGIHRTLDQVNNLRKANCIIVLAGMEGALASVVGGLVSVPIIAVPTSVGYGASFRGLAALLSMLNSCSDGVSVVNIDNGYGAGYIASQINKLAEKNLLRN